MTTTGTARTFACPNDHLDAADVTMRLGGTWIPPHSLVENTDRPREGWRIAAHDKQRQIFQMSPGHRIRPFEPVPVGALLSVWTHRP